MILILWFPLSAISRSPSGMHEIPYGLLKRATMPLPIASPGVPFPATVATFEAPKMSLMAWFLVSDTQIFSPDLSTATSYGLLNRAPVQVPSTKPATPVGLPATRLTFLLGSIFLIWLLPVSAT
jgi:hypothetical protein